MLFARPTSARITVLFRPSVQPMSRVTLGVHFLKCSDRDLVSHPLQKCSFLPTASQTPPYLKKVIMQCRLTLRDALGDLCVISHRLNLSLSTSLSSRDRCEPAPIKMWRHPVYWFFFFFWRQEQFGTVIPDTRCLIRQRASYGVFPLW